MEASFIEEKKFILLKAACTFFLGILSLSCSVIQVSQSLCWGLKEYGLKNTDKPKDFTPGIHTYLKTGGKRFACLPDFYDKFDICLCNFFADQGNWDAMSAGCSSSSLQSSLRMWLPHFAVKMKRYKVPSSPSCTLNKVQCQGLTF